MMRKKEFIKELLVYLLFAAILYFFYRSLWAFAALPFAVFFYHRYNRKNINKKITDELSLQFKDALISMSAALRAGYSVENSISESRREMASVYGESSAICTQLGIVISELHLGTNAENAISAMAARCSVPDISTFAAVFSTAKRSGGNMVEIIKKTADDISAKADIQNEISVLISSKKLEQKIMTVMPLGIIVYISVSSPSMLDPLYGNVTGAVIMTVCLGVYILAWFLSQKMMKIEV